MHRRRRYTSFTNTVDRPTDRGRRFEKVMKYAYGTRGYKVTPRRTGCDIEITSPPHPITGRRKHEYVEFKATPTAPIRPLQKKMQKEKGKKYRVQRPLGY